MPSFASAEPPAPVRDLAAARAAARADGDYARADALREQLRDAGWLVEDSDAGYQLRPAPAYAVLDDVAAVPPADGDYARADALREQLRDAGWLVEDSDAGYQLRPAPAYAVLDDVAAVPPADGDAPARRATIALLVDGWPDDLRACLAALLAHLPPGVVVLGLDLGDVDGAGATLHEVASAHPGVIEAIHVARPAPFGAARGALLRADPAPVHVWMETSTRLDGDALTPLLDALEDPSVVGAGWQGGRVGADWTTVEEAGPGEVEVVFGYLFAMRGQAARAVAADPEGPFARARFYRNADVEVSFALRAAGGRLVVPAGLPVHQTRHRGYHDSDPAWRDRESRRNYDRFLRRYRDRSDLRLPRPG